MRLMGWNANTNPDVRLLPIDIAPIIIVAFFTTLLVFPHQDRRPRGRCQTVLKIAIVFLW